LARRAVEWLARRDPARVVWWVWVAGLAWLVVGAVILWFLWIFFFLGVLGPGEVLLPTMLYFVAWAWWVMDVTRLAARAGRWGDRIRAWWGKVRSWWRGRGKAVCWVGFVWGSSAAGFLWVIGALSGFWYPGWVWVVFPVCFGLAGAGIAWFVGGLWEEAEEYAKSEVFG